MTPPPSLRRRIAGLLCAAVLVAACGEQTDPPRSTTDASTSDAGADGGRDISEGESSPDVPPGDSLLIIDNVTVIDAGGVRPERAVVIRGGEIDAVASADNAWPDAAHIIDGAGQYVIPGLVDVHVHLALSGATVWVGDPLEANLRANLYHGVTAVMDTGGPEVLFELREKIAAGEMLGPTVLATGPFLTTEGSHPCELRPDPQFCSFVGPDDAASRAEELLAEGADAVKIAFASASFTPWPTPRLEIEAVRRAAQVEGAPVIAHVDTSEDTVMAVQAGVDILAHPPFDDAITEDALAAAGESRGVHTTLGAFGSVLGIVDGETSLEEHGLIVGPGVEANWEAIRDEPELLVDGWVEESRQWRQAAEDNLVELRRAGANVVPGSDAGYYFVPHGLGLRRELEALAGLGWTPRELLEAVTLDARRLLGLPGGLVEPGASADLLLLAENPLEDISALGSITRVVLGGDPYLREELRSVDLYPRLSGEGEICLEQSDCGSGLRCDRVDHVCRSWCVEPYAALNQCGERAWCMPVDGTSRSLTGTCHPEMGCDLYEQNCGPAYYDLACVPLDVDTNTCWSAGSGRAGERCDPLVPELACEAGLFCSWLDDRCYRLCDPDAPGDTCPEGESCALQYADTDGNTPWFGICL